MMGNMATTMKTRAALLLPMLFVLLQATAAAAPAEDFSADGPHKVETLTEDWTDAARGGRVVPVKIYYPADLSAPAPVVIFSHGLGGSREGYGYLGDHLASHGYIAVHVTHAGSDNEALRDAFGDAAAGAADAQAVIAALRKVAANPANVVNRPKDISFAIDQLLEINKKEGPLKDRIDREKIGVAGHSFGGYTAIAVAGQTFPGGITFGDKRVKAVVAMSPPVRQPNAKQFEPITIPVLIMTGTLDESPLGGGGGADERLKVFNMLTGCQRYLLVFEGGDHMVFSGRSANADRVKLPGNAGDRAKDPEFQAFVKASTLRFFDAYLKGDDAAKRWLTADDGAKAALGSNGTWKHAAPEK